MWAEAYRSTGAILVYTGCPRILGTQIHTNSLLHRPATPKILHFLEAEMITIRKLKI